MKKILFLKNRVFSVRKDLLLMFLMTLVWITLYDFWLINIPEIFPKGAVVGSIFYKICFAYITAFIFFFLNVHLQNYKAKVQTVKFVTNKIKDIELHSRDLMLTILGQTYDERSFEELLEKCKTINPKEPSTYGLSKLAYAVVRPDWRSTFHFVNVSTKRLVVDLVSVNHLLDSKTLSLITEIEQILAEEIDVHYGYHIHLIEDLDRREYYNNMSLKYWAKSIFEYRKKCKELLMHLEDNYKKYQIEYDYKYK
ncbi:hypothetical protein CN374_29105 [Bacillus cereus]|nr:hypothetical protein CN374_29105 [Bacillus cereus]